MFQQVDLGTKKGGALELFNSKHRRYFPAQQEPIRRANSLGIDLKSEYEQAVIRRGFKFRTIDLSSKAGLAELPPAEYYTAFHFLEHLPSREWSSVVVHRMLDLSQKGCWIRMPSFEQQGAEAELKRYGLRFAWTKWSGHPSHYTLCDLGEAVASWVNKNGKSTAILDVHRMPNGIKSSKDHRVVPIDAPEDTIKYHKGLSPKPHLKLSNYEIPAEYECIIRIKRQD